MDNDQDTFKSLHFKYIHSTFDTFSQNMHHMYRSLGGWTFAFSDYYEQNITRYLDHPNTQLMADIIDPYGKEHQHFTLFNQYNYRNVFLRRW